MIFNFIFNRLAHRPDIVNIFNNIKWQLLDRILRIGVSLFVGVWFARYLGPEKFGTLNFALVVTEIFGAFAALGLGAIIVRDIVLDASRAGATLGSAIALQVLASFIAYLLMLLTIIYIRPGDIFMLSIVAILGSITILKVSEVVIYFFEAKLLSKYTVLVQSSIFIVFSLVKILMILSHQDFIAFVWVIVCEAFCMAIALLVVMNVFGLKLKFFHINISRIKKLLKDSYPLAISGVAVAVYMKIDQIMLG
jgi:O-antigen/teichoic acid export membrane protein